MSKVLKFLRSDLAEYLQLPYGVANRPMELIGDLAKEEWTNLSPKSAQDENQFYLNTKHYLQECTDWHDKDSTVRKWHKTLLKYAEKENWQSILDYGAGIATQSLILAEESNIPTIVIADFNCPSLSFVSWKAMKYRLEHKVKFLMFDPNLPVQLVYNDYDCIICTDVIGHSTQPYAMLAEILTHCQWTLWNSDFRVSATDRYPMHHMKPRNWDTVWDIATQPVESFLYKSRVFGQDANELVQRWQNIR